MHYVHISQHGDVSGLCIATGPAPQPQTDEVLIGVAMAGVNRPDIFQRQGSYPVPPGASPIMGLEVAGRVLATGAGVSRYRVGEEICALTNGGGYAEQACAPVSQCLPIPAGLSMREAAALPETCFTVWSNVFDRGRLQAGEWLMVHGGASGIGTTAIQMAKLMGASVMVTASSAEKCQACLDLGADAAINYNEEDFVERSSAITDERGIDVILDMVGGDYVQRNIKAAATEGRIVSIAFLRGARVELNLTPVMINRLTLTGSTLRPQSTAVKAKIAQQLEQHIWPHVAAGRLRPRIAAEFPLAAVADAHSLMESNRVVGKIVLNLQEEG